MGVTERVKRKFEVVRAGLEWGGRAGRGDGG